MSGNFEERFKGKTSKMDKTGLNALIGNNQAPVTKDSHTLLNGSNDQNRYGGGHFPVTKPMDMIGVQGGASNYPGSPIAKVGQKASSSKEPPEYNTKKGNYLGGSSQKHSVMNDAGSKALKQDADGRYSTNNSNAKPVYEEARKQANTAPTNNSKAGMKNGGQFQSNAMMMMAPFPMNNGMQPMGMMTPMPMYQPVAVHTSNGLQMMQPGYYPQMGMNVQPVAYPMMGMQGYPTKPGGDSMAGGNYAYMPNQYILGSKSASNYYSHNNFDPSGDPNNRHGLTEQGNFHVGSGLPQKGLGEYIPTKSAGDSDNKRKFTPYTINDYKSLSRTHKTKLGGLGANLNEDWEEKIKKNEKTKEFSNMIRGLNSDKISKQVVKPKVVEKTPTVRDKALAFARNVPKPKAKRNDEKGSQPNQNSVAERQIDDEINRMENDLEALERQHQFYQEKISKLKS